MAITPVNKLFAELEASGKLRKLSNIYFRWQDEKEYEEWSDYVETIEKVFSPLVIKVSKRPFGFSTMLKSKKVVFKVVKKGSGASIVCEIPA